MPVRVTSTICNLLLVVTYTATGMQPLQAQPATSDSAFLACARHSDRGQRIACLEDALQAATAAQEVRSVPAAAAAPSTPSPQTTSDAPAAPVSATAAAPAATSAATSTATTATTTAAAPAAEPGDDPSLLERVRSFGRNVSLSQDDSGSERLHDSITALEKRDDLWIVTLSSGQVWRQEVPRTLNLRVGDAIEIYQAGFGNGYRLATPRLSGFIRVERIR